MPEQIIVNVDDPDDLLVGYGAAAKVRLERDTTSAFGSPVEVATQTIVSGTTQYEFWDSGGTSASWYRSRYSATAGAPFSEYSSPFQPGNPTAYATLDALREYLNVPDVSSDNVLSDLLEDASRHLDEKCGRDFLRHPGVSGTETRTFLTERGNLLEVRAGIVSLDTVELAPYTGAAYSTLAADDWTLWPTDPEPYHSYSGVALTDTGSYRYWYPALAGARLTGVFGFAQVPPLIRRATLDLAREWYRQGPGGGGPVGVNQFGTPIFGAGEPKSVRDAIEEYAWSRWLVA
jgi:hypothetical protein